MNICSICGTSYKGMGNNAQPVNDGRCCDKCNFLKVIPARMENTDKYFHQYPKSQKFLKETEEALGEKAAFVDIKERDELLVSELRNCVLNDLSKLTARIGLPATKAFILDWVDTIKF